MNDEEFLSALESCRLPEREFDHGAHVRAAYLYLYLCRGDFARALLDIRQVIRNYAGHHGKGDRYHETITVACVALIHQHLWERGHGGGWEGFARENPELLQPGLLGKFYRPTQLAAPLARRVFVLPRPGAGR